MRIITISLALLMALPAVGQKSRKQSEETPVMVTGGITYSLPQTGIRVKVKATRTDFYAGPYAIYAEPLLGIQNVKNQSRVSWNIDQVELESFAEPDPAQQYKTGSSSGVLIQLTPDGRLAGINTAPPEFSECKTLTNSYAAPAPPVIPPFSRMTNNTDLTGRSSIEQRAAAAASAILKARSARLEIVTGMLDEFHPDGKAYDKSLRELNQIEKSNLELFVGKAHSREYSFSFDFIPPAQGARGEVVFRFDETLGFLSKNDFSGKPVTIDVEAAINSGGQSQGVTGQATPATHGSGLFYRQPAFADIKVSRELTTLATGRLPIAQMGTVAPIPPELLNGSFAVYFWPETGAVRSVTKNQ